MMLRSNSSQGQGLFSSLSFYLLTAMFLFGAIHSSEAVVDPSGKVAKPFVVTGQLEVQFSDDVILSGATRSFGRVALGSPSIDAVLRSYQIREMRAVFPWRTENSADVIDRRLSRFQIIEFPESSDMNVIASDLLATGKVVAVDTIWAHPLEAVTPDDPQWGLQYAPALIGANAVWEVEPGSDTAKLALLDSGVNYKHEDLRDKVWVNPGEDLDGDGEVWDLDDLNGVDDDGNGLVDDVIGYDFFTGFGGLGVWSGEDGAGVDNDPNDYHGHGTHCAGIAAAATNNTAGVAGIGGGSVSNQNYYNRGPRIMCVRIGAKADDGLGYVTMSAAAAGIDYAAKMGADVISCSWGSSATGALAAALALADDSGIVVAKAAGNSNTSDATDDYMNILPSVTAVASTNSSDTKSGFSNFGEWVEISAPGSGIRSTVSTAYVPSYAYMSGTSMATPAYAGAVLLIKSLMPSWTKVEIESLLFSSAENIDALNPSYVGLLGAGRVDVANALQSLPVALFSAGPSLIGTPGLSVDFADLSPNSPSAWNWDFGDGSGSTTQHPSHTYNSPGIYDVTLEVTEPNGTGFERMKHLVLVQADTVGSDSGEGLIGESFAVPVSLKNDFQVKSIILPISYADANGASLIFDSISSAGTRTSHWDVSQVLFDDPVAKELVVELKSDTVEGHSRYLQSGTGPVINLDFTFQPGSAPLSTVPLTSGLINGSSLTLETIHGSYAPAYTPALAVMGGCCNLPGDADNSGSVNIGDATSVINRIFTGGGAPPCADEADADGSNALNIADVTYIIQLIFSGGSAPVCGTTGA